VTWVLAVPCPVNLWLLCSEGYGYVMRYLHCCTNQSTLKYEPMLPLQLV